MSSNARCSRRSYRSRMCCRGVTCSGSNRASPPNGSPPRSIASKGCTAPSTLRRRTSRQRRWRSRRGRSGVRGWIKRSRRRRRRTARRARRSKRPRLTCGGRRALPPWLPRRWPRATLKPGAPRMSLLNVRRPWHSTAKRSSHRRQPRSRRRATFWTMLSGSGARRRGPCWSPSTSTPSSPLTTPSSARQASSRKKPSSTHCGTRRGTRRIGASWSGTTRSARSSKRQSSSSRTWAPSCATPRPCR
mmetsp:Transcript_27505/g.70175  ORF Transcript_27505/g.70175 Transcript_27505/m.70175 type:complete len:246 (-) Transcript_27505:472-1209(-)